MEKVSVIIPAHNSEKYIRETVESALNQTYPDMEIIVADDGSTDGTFEAIKDFIDCSRIKYLRHKTNQGPAATRNTSIKASTGHYIAFLDSDDIWNSDKIERQVNFFKKNPGTGVCYCNGTYLHNTERLYPQDELLVSYPNYFELLLNNVIVWPSSVLFERMIIDETGLMDERFRYAEDIDFFLQINQKFSFTYLPECLLRRRVHPESIMSSINNRAHNHLLLYNKHKTALSKQQANLFRKFIGKVMFSYARKNMSAMNFGEGISAYRASVILSARYMPKIFGLLTRYLRFRLRANKNLR